MAEVLGRVSPDWLAEGPFQSPLPAFEPFPNFGQQRLYNKAVASVHSGVDIAAPRGTEAVAPNSGRVVLANRLYYSGWTVIIDHGRGVFTYCCHFDELLVKRGDLGPQGAGHRQGRQHRALDGAAPPLERPDSLGPGRSLLAGRPAA